MKMVSTVSRIHAKIDHIHQINESIDPSNSRKKNAMADMKEDPSDMVSKDEDVTLKFFKVAPPAYDANISR